MKPPRRDHLASHMVVWIAHLSQAEDSLSALERYLDSRDRERAARFHFAEDRGRFVLGRALARMSLGYYLEQLPETIELAYTDRGRPYYPHDGSINFSISHTKDLVAIGVTAGARIGIDVEAVEATRDLPELAEHIFSPADLAKFQSLPSDRKLAAFYRAWTGKEAYLKARGEGIADGLQQICVSFAPDEGPSIEDRRIQVAEAWRLDTLPVPANYAGALACDDRSRRLEGAFVRVNRNEIVEASSF